MDTIQVLKALSDETRMKILKMLLEYNLCVRAIARRLNLTEATVSQHLKVLRECGLIEGEKRGYFMHYNVNKEILKRVSAEILSLTEIEKETCSPKLGGCSPSENERCHVMKDENQGIKRCCKRAGEGRCGCRKHNVE